MELFLNLFFLLFLLGLAYGTGIFIESRHYEKIKKRESDYCDLPAVTSKNIEDPSNYEFSRLVEGSVVVSLDYFKRFLASLRTIVGGRVKSYEPLLDRGRREAVLRMKEKARLMGADIVINMRFQTSAIGQVTQQRNSLGCFEILAYGTAVKLKNK